jgi:preprotein translocase subunit SecB
MPRKVKSPVATINDKQAFLKSIKLLAVRLISSECRIERDRYFALLDDRDKSSVSITSDYRLVNLTTKSFEVEGVFSWVAKNAKNETGLSLVCIYQAHFYADDAQGHRVLAKEFAQSEMRLILWPYFRQFAFETSARMAIPPITVPLTTELEDSSPQS